MWMGPCVCLCVILHSALSLLIHLLLLVTFAPQTLQPPKLPFSYISDIGQSKHWQELVPGFFKGSLEHEVFTLLCDIMIYGVA